MQLYPFTATLCGCLIDNFVQQSQKSMNAAESAVFVENLNKYFAKYQAYKLYMYNRTLFDSSHTGHESPAYVVEHFMEVLQVVSNKVSTESAPWHRESKERACFRF